MAQPTVKQLEQRIETLESAVICLLQIFTFPGRLPLPDAEELEPHLETLQPDGDEETTEETD